MKLSSVVLACGLASFSAVSNADPLTAYVNSVITPRTGFSAPSLPFSPPIFPLQSLTGQAVGLLGSEDLFGVYGEINSAKGQVITEVVVPVANAVLTGGP